MKIQRVRATVIETSERSERVFAYIRCGTHCGSLIMFDVDRGSFCTKPLLVLRDNPISYLAFCPYEARRLVVG